MCLGQPTITIHLTVNNSQALVLDTAGPITPTYPLRLYYWQLSVGYNVSFSLQGLHRMYSCNMTVTYLQPMPARGVIGATLQCDMDGSLNGSTFTCSSDDESANVTLLILLCQSPYYPHPNGTSSVNGTSSAQDIMYTLAQGTKHTSAQDIMYTLAQGTKHTSAQDIMYTLAQGTKHTLAQGIMYTLAQGTKHTLAQGTTGAAEQVPQVPRLRDQC